MLSAGFEPAVPSSQRPRTGAFDRAATGTDVLIFLVATYCVAHLYEGYAPIQTAKEKNPDLGSRKFV